MAHRKEIKAARKRNKKIQSKAQFNIFTTPEPGGAPKGVKDALNELREGNNARAESKNELPPGIDKTMNRHSKDIEELNGHVDKLKTSIDNNISGT